MKVNRTTGERAGTRERRASCAGRSPSEGPKRRTWERQRDQRPTGASATEGRRPGCRGRETRGAAPVATRCFGTRRGRKPNRTVSATGEPPRREAACFGTTRTARRRSRPRARRRGRVNAGPSGPGRIRQASSESTDRQLSRNPNCRRTCGAGGEGVGSRRRQRERTFAGRVPGFRPGQPARWTTGVETTDGPAHSDTQRRFGGGAGKSRMDRHPTERRSRTTWRTGFGPGAAGRAATEGWRDGHGNRRPSGSRASARPTD